MGSYKKRIVHDSDTGEPVEVWENESGGLFCVGPFPGEFQTVDTLTERLAAKDAEIEALRVYLRGTHERIAELEALVRATGVALRKTRGMAYTAIDELVTEILAKIDAVLGSRPHAPTAGGD